MLTTDGVWRPNGIRQAKRFATLEQQFNRLRVTAKWWAFQSRRNGDAASEAFWTKTVELHEVAITQLPAPTPAHWMLDHVTHRDPYPTITAPPALRMYTARAEQNSVSYFAQSAATAGGKVAPFQLLTGETSCLVS